VGHQAAAEEALLPGEGAVDELVRDDEGARGQVLPQGTHGTHGHHVRDARALEGVDVGAVVDVRGRDAMASAVAGQEDHGLAVQFAEKQFVRGLAKG
jgi:hypothetical protein